MESKQEKIIDWKKIVIITIVILIAINVITKILKIRSYDKQMNSALINETFTKEQIEEFKNGSSNKNEVIVEYNNNEKRYAPTADQK